MREEHANLEKRKGFLALLSTFGIVAGACLLLNCPNPDSRGQRRLASQDAPDGVQYPAIESESEAAPRQDRLLYSSEGAAECGLKRPIGQGNVEINVSSKCVVTVQPSFEMQMENKDRARNFSFFPDGMLMIFISTGDFPKLSQSTGSRTFTFFPRKPGPIQIFETAEGFLKISTAAGTIAHVDPDRATVVSIDGYEIKESAKLDAENSFRTVAAAKGGIEVLPTPGAHTQMIDYGWRVGDVAYGSSGAMATVYGERAADGRIKTCRIKASLLFSVSNKDNFAFRYTSDEELNEALKKSCR